MLKRVSVERTPRASRWADRVACSGVMKVLRLRAEGMSWRKITEMLDVPMSTAIDSFRQSTDSCNGVESCK